MTAWVQKYRCPDCGQGFRWPAQERPPDFCPACGSFVGEEYDPGAAPSAPAVHTKVRSLDSVYRQMEDGSKFRAQVAAEMTGASEAEMSAIKITDMKDRPHEGEHSAIVRPNPVSDLMRQPLAAPVGMVGPNGAGYAQTAHSGRMPDGSPIRGDVPHAGALAAKFVNERHHQIARAVIEQGRTGR